VSGSDRFGLCFTLGGGGALIRQFLILQLLDSDDVN